VQQQHRACQDHADEHRDQQGEKGIGRMAVNPRVIAVAPAGCRPGVVLTLKVSTCM